MSLSPLKPQPQPRPGIQETFASLSQACKSENGSGRNITVNFLYPDAVSDPPRIKPRTGKKGQGEKAVEPADHAPKAHHSLSSLWPACP